MFRFISLSLIPHLVFLAASGAAAEKQFVEPDYGFSFDKASWKEAPIPVRTLGEPCAVLVDGPAAKSLFVVFVRSSPEKPQQAPADRLPAIEERLDRIAGAVDGVEKVSSESIEIGGRPALSYRMSGPGNGLGLGQGETTTLQHWFAVPRGRDLIVFQLTAAEANFAAGYEKLQPVLETVSIDDERPAPAAERTFHDDELELSLDYPGSPWIRGGYELGDFFAPGYLLRLWSAPSEQGTTGDGVSNYATRLAMFLQFGGRAFEPQELIDVSIPGLTGALGATVVEQDVREIAGLPAMWLLVEGKSETGSAITNSGDVRTRQLWVAIPRNDDTPQNIVVFVLTTPAADYEARVADFQKMLGTLKLQ